MSESNEFAKVVVAVVNSLISQLRDRKFIASGLIGGGIGATVGTVAEILTNIIVKSRGLATVASAPYLPLSIGILGAGSAMFLYQKYREQECLTNFRKNHAFICERMANSGFADQAKRLSELLILVENKQVSIDYFTEHTEHILHEYISSLTAPSTKGK